MPYTPPSHPHFPSLTLFYSWVSIAAAVACFLANGQHVARFKALHVFVVVNCFFLLL